MGESTRTWDAVYQRLQAGDADAWSDLYALLGRLIGGRSRGLDREDLLHDVAHRLVRTLLERNAGRGSVIQNLRAFCTQVIRNEIRHRVGEGIKESSQTGTGDVGAHAAPSPGPPDQALAAELRQTVRRALARLPRHEAEVIARHHLEGDAILEIHKEQAAQGSSESYEALLSRLGRARRHLARLLRSDAGLPASLTGRKRPPREPGSLGVWLAGLLIPWL